MSQDPTTYGDTPQPDLIIAHPRHEVVHHVAQTDDISLTHHQAGDSLFSENEDPASIAQVFPPDEAATL